MTNFSPRRNYFIDIEMPFSIKEKRHLMSTIKGSLRESYSKESHASQYKNKDTDTHQVIINISNVLAMVLEYISPRDKI